MKLTVGIIGLGYVGLPLAIALSRKHKIVGYDINKKRVEELKKLMMSLIKFPQLILKKHKSIFIT